MGGRLEAKKLTVQAFAEIVAERWRSACEHLEKTIASMQAADNASDVLQRHLVVELGAHTDSETTPQAMRNNWMFK